MCKASTPSKETERPFGGAPTMRDGMPESETPQAAIDCPTASGGTKEISNIPPAALGASTEATGEEPEDEGGDNFSGAAVDLKKCASPLLPYHYHQDNVMPASTITIDVIATPEQVEHHRKWIKKNFFARPPYPGRERLEDWLFQQLLYASPSQRDSFTKAFRSAESKRPAASLSYLIEKALPVLGKKELKLPDEL